ncbi:hypothetical protein CVT26_009945 [Gymnopilus dilepis]|uniref:Acyltransferase 3 domain-containing protein n=1 Tax=Gymnopilus dilepis TaxID=231916 RepID=A0A409VL39_9AGAR|nr:hypothetical protein CVT26_009945 [Gymnopilus dilepis]
MTSAHTPTESSPLLGPSEPPVDPEAAAQALPPTQSDEEPTTSRPEPHRVHWVDNLRTFLTVSLIFHHAVLETAYARRSSSEPEILLLSLYTALHKSLLWTLFFFTSGYSASLAVNQTLTNSSRGAAWAFFQSRTLKVVLPALLYGMLGRALLFLFLTFGWEDIFGSYKSFLSFVRLSGPVPFVAMLFAFDCSYLFVRWIRRHPDLSHWSSFPNTSPSQTLAVAFLVFILSTFLGCIWTYQPLYPILIFWPYDVPYPGAPTSFLIAYITGVNLLPIQRYIASISTLGSIRKHIGVAFLLSLTCAGLSLGLAQHLWPPLSDFIRLNRSGGLRQDPFFKQGGLNAHTVFFTLWMALVFFVVQPLSVGIFTRYGKRNFGIMTRHTYGMTYVNAIPILIASYYIRASVHSLILEAFAVGFVGTLASWLATTVTCLIDWL